MTRGVELRFWAAVHSIETGDERHLATFYIMNTSVNQNNWRVTDKALDEALPTLIGKPLGCIPGYRVDHVHEPLQVGRWVRVEKPDGYALATAEITDLVAWGKLLSGEWSPISVVILAYKVTCSVCGEDITSGPDEHTLNGEGHEVVESFRFKQIDFVSAPAYPQAGVITLGHLTGAEGSQEALLIASVVPFEETVKAPEERAWDANVAESRIRSWAGGPDKENVSWSKYRRAFAWYDREDPENFGSYKLPHHDVIDGRLSVVWRSVSAAMGALLGARGGVNIPVSDRRSVWSHLAWHYRQYEKPVPDFHASQSNMDGAQGPRGNPKPDEKEEKRLEEKIAELQQELETVKAEKGEMEEKVTELRQEVETLKTENAELKEDLERRRAERHQELVDRAVEARLEAGLTRDREAEAGHLKELDNSTLILLAEDAEKVAEKMAKAPPASPKAKYSAGAKSGFDAAVEDMREQLFGYRRGGET